MKKILYVHGYNSNPETSSTRQNLQKLLGTDYEVLGIEYLQENPHIGLKQIKAAIEEIRPDLVVGSSLGGFFTLCLGCSSQKLVINPCMKPSVELPKLGFEKSVQAFKDLELERIWSIKDSEDYETTVGIFGDHDELFSYEDTFKEIYRGSKTKRISAGHKLTQEELRQVIPEIENLLNKDFYALFSVLHL